MSAEAQWQALLGAAILGADRGGGHAASADGEAGVLLELANARDPAEAMLAHAAILSVYCRAGRRVSGGAAAPEPAPEDDRSACSTGAGRQLAAILFEEFSDLLPEWCALADAAALRAPDELLPALLRRTASARRGEAAAIRAVLGGRGRWLAAQDPRWSSAFTDRDDSLAWDGGDIEDRFVALTATRGKDAPRAREMLTESWEGEAADDRAKLLPALAEGLSQDDEDFLESALDDRQAKVREAATELLAQLPDSRYGARMTERLRELVQLHEKRGLMGSKAILEVTLPEKTDKAMKRDGLSDRQLAGLGKKASLLLGIVAGAPLGAWASAEPAAWLAAASKSEWRDALLWGWAQAAARQGSANWAAALLDMFQGVVKSAKHLEPHKPALLAAMAAADPARREAAALARMGDGDPRVAGVLLSACDHDWSTKFSAGVLAWLKKRFPEKPADGYQLRELVKKDFGRRMDPALAGDAAAGWRTNRDGWSSGLDEMVDRFSRTLEFRADMQKELKP